MRIVVSLVVVLVSSCGDSGDPGNIDAALTADATPSADATGADAWLVQDPLSGAGAAILIDNGYMFVEGPAWRPADGVLLFSDIPAATIYRLTPPSAIDVFRASSGNANGLASDTDGLLLAAEHGNRRVSRTMAGGQVVDVATHYMSLRLNSPNDIAVRSDGTIYFTDPPYGIAPSDQELSFNGVFRLPPGGTLTAEWEGALTTRPNGIGLSPDQTVLYVADTTGPVRAYDVATDGSLSNERVFTSDVSTADGMCIDVAGNVLVTTDTGVRAFAPNGSPWGTIAVPEVPANCTYGGSDRRTLYITARTGLYQVQMVVPGT